MTIISEGRAITAPRPKRLFPLVPHVSCRLTQFLLEVPVTANHITVAATAIGLAGAWCFLQGGMAASLSGAILFIFSSILDNCDGEVARLKGSSLDLVVDLATSATGWFMPLFSSLWASMLLRPTVTKWGRGLDTSRRLERP